MGLKTGLLSATAVACAISLSYGTSPANAAPIHSSPTITSSIGVRSPRPVDSFSESVALLEPYVHYGSNSITLKAPQTVLGMIDSQLLEDITSGLKGINSQIQQGLITVTAVQHGGISTRDAGENSLTLHWWGWNLKLSNDTFNKLSKAGWGAAGATAVLGGLVSLGIITIPHGVSLVAVATILGGIVGLLQPCNWNDRGVEIRYLFIGPSHCWPQ